jgi:hypothetical protein
MADVNKTVSINYQASTQDLEKALKRIPGITDAQAKKAAADLDKNFKKMERSADSTSKSISSKMSKMTKSFGAVTAAVGALGVGVVALGQRFADLTNELVDASSKTGIAVDTLAGLRLAAEGSGLSFANLEGGLIKFQGSILEASRGSKNLSDSFDRLGVSITDSNGELRDADSVFNDTIKALGEMDNQTERNAVAMQVFGRQAGAGLIQSGALENLDSMTNLASDFGIAINDDAIASMATFQRKMAEFDTVATGTMQRLLESIAGKNSVNMGLEAATRSMIYFGSIASDVIAATGQGFENIFGLIQIAQLNLNKRFSEASELETALQEDTVIAVNNLSNAFSRADAEVAKFNADSAKTNATLSAGADGADDASGSMDGYTQSIKNANAELQTMTDIISGVFDKNIELADAVRDRLTPEYTKQRNQILALRTEIELQSDAINDQYDALLNQSQVRQLSIQEQNQLLVLAEEIAEIDKIAAQNRIAEQQEMQALVDDMHQTRIDQIAKEKDLQAAAQREHLDGIASTMGAFGDLTASLSELVTAYAGENQEAQERVFKTNQALAVADVAFKTAQAIAAALTLPPVARGVAIATASATGAAQLATIASQSPPKFDVGGMIGSSSDASQPDSMTASVLRGEAILDRTTVRQLGGEEGIRRLQNGQGGAEVVIIQPFKHLDRYNRAAARRVSRQVGSGAY